jgi:hypothetical protein
MTTIIPFRQSSFFFGRKGSYGAHAGAANGAVAAAAAAADAADSEQERELRQGLLEGDDIERCEGDPDNFEFSWQRLLLHVGCVWSPCAPSNVHPASLPG